MFHIRITGLAVIAVLCSLPLGLPHAGGESVEIRGGDGQPHATYTLALTEAPREVRAFGVELTYDLKVLRYTGSFARGSLVEAFEFFNVNEPEPGQIRLGGFTVAHRIPAGTSGNLVALEFERIGEGDAALRVVHLVDDLAVKKGADEPPIDQGPKR